MEMKGFGWGNDKSSTQLKKLKVGLPEGKEGKLEGIVQNNFCDDFVTKMKNAMCMSYFKYGDVNDRAGDVAIEKIYEELRRFMEDKNTEHLINVANEAMIRFMFPKQDEHYKGTDSDMSIISGKKMSVSEHIRNHILNF